MIKKMRCLIIIVMLCFIIVGPIEAAQQKEIQYESDDLMETNIKELIQSFQHHIPIKNNIIQNQPEINLPWRNSNDHILEWWISIEYNGKTYESQVPVSISDFTEKFLKHPEYGEIIRFDIDDDKENDIEVIASFYWSVLKDTNGFDIDSLEKRIRFRQLETGNYVDETDASITVWSELHINYGLFKSKKSSCPIPNRDIPFLWLQKLFSFKQHIISQLPHDYPLLYNWMKTMRNNIQRTAFYHQPYPTIEPIANDDNDYISIGMGFRSEQGEDIPRYMEKRFAFAKEQLFTPTIFQQQTDPGSAKGQTRYENLYGFKSYKSGSTSPSYNIEFSTKISPTISMKSKFIPRKGQLFYYFDETSQQSSPTELSYTTNIIQGSGEDISLSLLLQSIDSSLGKTGEWMGFDIDVFGDNDLLSGSFHYTASNRFTIDMILNSPSFEEKIEIQDIPTSVDISWDMDFIFLPSPDLYVNINGIFDVNMSDDIGNLMVYYPKTDPNYEDTVFVSIPDGIPQSLRFEAAASLNLNLMNLLDNGNYVSGRIAHECSANINAIQIFLPDESTPIVKVSDIPSMGSFDGRLYWNQLKGHVEMRRGSIGPADPIEINLDYENYHVHDIITIRNGYINSQFKIGTNGYFSFDTSEGIIGNQLAVSNMDSGDSISLLVDEVSADQLQAKWDIDTSGEQLKINDIGFHGMVDTLKGLSLDLQMQGKHTHMNLDWVLGETGYFKIFVDQEDDIILDFSEFAQNNSDIELHGGITISEYIVMDMDWQLKQGEETQQGNVNPGSFSINKYNDQAMIKTFDFYLTYQDQYGVDITFDNLQFYLDFEWWKGDRILPYLWLDYEMSSDDFDVNLLWTNGNGETQWYESVEEW